MKLFKIQAKLAVCRTRTLKLQMNFEESVQDVFYYVISADKM